MSALPIPRAPGLEEYANEKARIVNALESAQDEFRLRIHEYAEAERNYRKAKARAWLEAPSGEKRGEWTAAQRESHVNAGTADLRCERDIAEGLKQSAVEAIRSYRAELSAWQSEMAAYKGELNLLAYGPEDDR